VGEGTPFSLDIHGFVSPGWVWSTHNNYLAKSTDGSFEFSEVGINFTKQLTDDLRFGVQLFARDLGPIGNYSPKFDWYYLDYHWRDWLAFRAGRIKIPFGLYNESADIDAARVPILLPSAMYPTTARDYLLAQTGFELYGRLRLGGAGAFEYRGYCGTIFVEPTPAPGAALQVTSTENPYVAGGRFFWETPLEGLRVGGTIQSLRLDTTFAFAATPTSVRVKVPVLLWVTSAEYVKDNLQLALEYGEWKLDFESTNPALFPTFTIVSQRGYFLAAYRLTSWLSVSTYYSLWYPSKEQRSGRQSYQGDLAGTFRFDINQYWLVKLEAHWMHGTAGLDSSLNDNIPLSKLAQDWAFVAVKTTLYF